MAIMPQAENRLVRLQAITAKTWTFILNDIQNMDKWWGKANCLFIFLTIVFRKFFSEAFLQLLGNTGKGENSPLPEGLKKYWWNIL